MLLTAPEAQRNSAAVATGRHATGTTHPHHHAHLHRHAVHVRTDAVNNGTLLPPILTLRRPYKPQPKARDGKSTSKKVTWCPSSWAAAESCGRTSSYGSSWHEGADGRSTWETQAREVTVTHAKHTRHCHCACTRAHGGCQLTCGTPACRSCTCGPGRPGWAR